MRVDFEDCKIYIGTKKEPILFDSILQAVGTLDSDIVYLAGSLIEGTVGKCSAGMGNDFSDVDVFIIRDHDKFLEHKDGYDYINEINKIFFVDMFDVEVYDESSIRQLFRAIKQRCYRKDIKPLNMIDFPRGFDFELANGFINRLVNSFCIQNREKYRSLQNNIPLTEFIDAMLTYLSVLVVENEQDIFGNCVINEFDTALLCSRSSFLKLIRIVLISEEVLSDREKWVPLKLRNLCSEKDDYRELLEMYIKLFRSDLSDNDSCYKTILESLQLSKKWTEKIMLRGISL